MCVHKLCLLLTTCTEFRSYEPRQGEPPCAEKLCCKSESVLPTQFLVTDAPTIDLHWVPEYSEHSGVYIIDKYGGHMLCGCVQVCVQDQYCIQKGISTS